MKEDLEGKFEANLGDRLFFSRKYSVTRRVDRDKPRNLEFGQCLIDFGLLLWTRDDSGLSTRPHTITKTLTRFLANIHLEHVGLIHPSCGPPVFFCAEQVEGRGVILTHFYSLVYYYRPP